MLAWLGYLIHTTLGDGVEDAGPGSRRAAIGWQPLEPSASFITPAPITAQSCTSSSTSCTDVDDSGQGQRVMRTVVVASVEV